MNVERDNDLLKIKVERLQNDIANIRKKLDETLDLLDEATYDECICPPILGYVKPKKVVRKKNIKMIL